MRVLHINQSDSSGGGAAVAACRLHNGLLDKSVDSYFLVGDKKTDDDRVEKFPAPQILERVSRKLMREVGLNYVSYKTSDVVSHHPFYQSADIVNLHNLHGDYFNYMSIKYLSNLKPTILTLHDIWSFTGHCGFNLNYACSKWETGCNQCPHLDVYPPIKRDAASIEWRLKDWTYSQSKLHIVSPSQWVSEQVKKSMLSRFPIHWIPHGLDTSIYQPSDLAQCRYLLGLPQDKYVLMVCSNNVEDHHKGGDLLFDVLRRLPEYIKEDIILLIMGQNSQNLSRSVGIPSVSLGYVSNDRIKAIAYSASDLFLHPTRADTFGLVLQESMACGTPMVSFNIGGVPDLVRPGETGYLAAPEDTTDFRNGIIELLEDSALRHQMAENCRTIALAEYRIEQQTDRYIALYQGLLG
jgi:glycosyltransferase involved in cell wall biosynthesis